MRNRFPGKCFKCQASVEAGKGFFQKVSTLSKEDRKKYLGFTKWLVRCNSCVGTGNK